MTDSQLDLTLAAPKAAGTTCARSIPRGANNHAPRNTTRTAAAQANGERRPSQRELVYLYVLGQGDRGATRKEIAANTGLSENSVRPRVTELQQQIDPATDHVRIFETGFDEDTREGCSVLYAGPFATIAGRRYAATRGTEFLRLFETARERAHRKQAGAAA